MNQTAQEEKKKDDLVIAPKRNNKKIWLKGIVFSVLLGVTLWVYWQFYLNYLLLEKTSRLSELLLQEQAVLLQTRGQKIAMITENLRKTATLVTQLKTENEKLQGQVKLLDKMPELEKTIALLEERNATLLAQMDTLREKGPDWDAEIQSVQDGKNYLSKYSDWIRKVKRRIRTIKHEAFQERVEARKEQDRIRSLLGNNGYVIRDGRMLPMDVPEGSPSQNIRVDVRFVR